MDCREELFGPYVPRPAWLFGDAGSELSLEEARWRDWPGGVGDSAQTSGVGEDTHAAQERTPEAGLAGAVDAEDEELIELTHAELQADPLFGAKVWQVELRGVTQAIAYATSTGDRLYLVRFDDGGAEDLLAAEVEALLGGRRGDGARRRGRGRRGSGGRRRH